MIYNTLDIKNSLPLLEDAYIPTYIHSIAIPAINAPAATPAADTSTQFPLAVFDLPVAAANPPDTVELPPLPVAVAVAVPPLPDGTDVPAATSTHTHAQAYSVVVVTPGEMALGPPALCTHTAELGPKSQLSLNEKLLGTVIMSTTAVVPILRVHHRCALPAPVVVLSESGAR
jgi:hypothetical protein